MAKIIILNAPPGAGKDTIGKLIEQYAPIHVRTISFKQPMFEIALAILGAKRYGDFIVAYNDREQKEKPHDFLMGMTCRQFMIWISEEVIKPKFGDDYFGKRFDEIAKESDYPVICTDGGFPDEVIALIEAGHDVKLCRLHRRGFGFDGDSRNYIRLPMKMHRRNVYCEHDFYLTDNKPMGTVETIINMYLK